MGLTLAIALETDALEKRVAVSPDAVKKYVSMGVTIKIQSGAGKDASFTDAQFREAGAKISKSYEDTIKDADVILCVGVPDTDQLDQIPEGTYLIGMLSPFSNEKILQDCAKRKLIAFSMEFVPRISRAQSMDVLSSQSNLAGYKSVLDAAEHYSRAFPMMMTAAGTVPPAKIFVMGAGVAGLQAIATAKRLGGVVSATDVRPAAKEQVESLGASFVAVENDEFKEAETAGGYAKEMSKDYQKQQAEFVAEHIAKQDIVITTALIPGRPAPKLITTEMVKSMKPGSVIVDLAVETGGNCAVSKAGEVVTKHDVHVVGHLNVPSRLATDASALYAKNLLNLLTLMIDKESQALAVDWEDEIIQGICMTKDGEVIHPRFAKKKATKKTKAKDVVEADQDKKET